MPTESSRVPKRMPSSSQPRNGSARVGTSAGCFPSQLVSIGSTRRRTGPCTLRSVHDHGDPRGHPFSSHTLPLEFY